jgi:prolipoprotein diacylglyceryltransferase
MNAVAYIWRGLINCFYLFVILYVFDNIQDKNTSIIIAVLALLYTTMRTIAGVMQKRSFRGSGEPAWVSAL